MWRPPGRGSRWRWRRRRTPEDRRAHALDFAAGARRSSLPARRPHHRRRGHGSQRHALQLLRHGHDPGFDGRDFLQPARGGADAAAGRRHRLRFLDAAPEGRAGERRRRGCVRPRLVHGCVGRDVPHDHERGLAPRRDDGDARHAIIPTSRISSPPSRRAGRLTNFNLSVLVSDAFMDAVKADAHWDLKFDGACLSRPCARAICGTASCARPMSTPSPA